MPIVLHRNINTNTQLAIWKMSESLEELQHSLVSIPENIKSNKRQKEWICVRLLLNYLVPNTNIIYNQYGAPTTSKGKTVSVSHSNNYCAILVSEQIAAIDIELISTKANRLKNKFIAKQEEKLITKSETSTLIWCAKECLFKIYQKGNLILKKDLIIKNIEKNLIKTTIKKKSYILHFEKFKNYYLVYYYE